MITYSIKELMGLCSDYALDAQIQKILFAFDLWVPKAAREVHIDNVAQQHHAVGSYSGFNRARSPSKIDSNDNNNRLRRTLAARSMSAEVFRSSIDTFNSGSNVRDSTKVNQTSSLPKKSSTGQTLEQTPSQPKLMPILEGGETEESTTRIHFSTTTLDWTPADNESTTNRTPMDALFELSVRADTALKTALCENNSTVSSTTNNDRLTIRKSVSVMNQKQKVGSGRSLIRAKSDMMSSDTNRKRTLTHLARLSEKYFNDDPKIIAEIEELEVEYLFNYIRHLKTFAKYAQMSEDEILQEVESDPHTLRQRTKEILKGKMSESYAEYIAKYPVKKQRQREQPTTPNKYRKCSRRCFDGQLRTWRRNLHQFDDIPTGGTNDNENDELTTADSIDEQTR